MRISYKWKIKFMANIVRYLDAEANLGNAMDKRGIKYSTIDPKGRLDPISEDIQQFYRDDVKRNFPKIETNKDIAIFTRSINSINRIKKNTKNKQLIKYLDKMIKALRDNINLLKNIKLSK